MLFVDYSSAFNTVVPCELVIKLTDLWLDAALRDWILNFLTNKFADNTTTISWI